MRRTLQTHDRKRAAKKRRRKETVTQQDGHPHHTAAADLFGMFWHGNVSPEMNVFMGYGGKPERGAAKNCHKGIKRHWSGKEPMNGERECARRRRQLEKVQCLVT